MQIHETGHENPKIIMYISFTLIMLVRSCASDNFLIQKIIPQNKCYKISCNNEKLHISCLLFITSYKVSETDTVTEHDVLPLEGIRGGRVSI